MLVIRDESNQELTALYMKLLSGLKAAGPGLMGTCMKKLDPQLRGGKYCFIEEEKKETCV